MHKLPQLSRTPTEQAVSRGSFPEPSCREHLIETQFPEPRSNWTFRGKYEVNGIRVWKRDES